MKPSFLNSDKPLLCAMIQCSTKAMLDAGASLVEIYSGFIFEGPALVKNIIKYLENDAK